jgi:hypothetical protein
VLGERGIRRRHGSPTSFRQRTTGASSGRASPTCRSRPWAARRSARSRRYWHPSSGRPAIARALIDDNHAEALRKNPRRGKGSGSATIWFRQRNDLVRRWRLLVAGDCLKSRSTPSAELPGHSPPRSACLEAPLFATSLRSTRCSSPTTRPTLFRPGLPIVTPRPGARRISSRRPDYAAGFPPKTVSRQRAELTHRHARLRVGFSGPCVTPRPLERPFAGQKTARSAPHFGGPLFATVSRCATARAAEISRRALELGIKTAFVPDFAPARALQAKNPVITGFLWSGRRESNPRLLLGRQGHYHYATPANWAGLDLNQRSAFARQIYSLVPLTTRPPTPEISLTYWRTLGTIPQRGAPRQG